MSSIQSILTEKKAELKRLDADRAKLIHLISYLETSVKELKKPTTKPAAKPSTPARKAGKTK